MADCYYHGYSGSPGACDYCKEEQERGLECGTLTGYDMSVTTDNWKRGRDGWPDK